jgi:thermitase
MLRLKYFAIVAAALTLTACGQPAATVAPVAANNAQTANVTNSPAAKADYNSLPAGTAVLVRYKDGQAPSVQGGTALPFDRTYRYAAGAPKSRAELISRFLNDPAVEVVEPDFKMYTFGTPSDPSYAKQWDMAKIQLPAAQDKTKGNANVIVASVDSGVDYNHPDLAGQVIKGKDFANNDDDPMDDNGHGSHTAGTMAAATNNAIGVAGIAPGCKILAVKVMGSDGGGDISAICSGIDYAVKQGAKVINLSLGGPQESQILRSSIQAAVKAGVLVVAAAGNDGNTTQNYPAAYPEVLSVGATDENDAKTSFSQYGSWVRIAAPGAHILSTFKGAYKELDGTSMASPHVAGAAGLLRSLHPEWTAEQVASTLIATGDACTGFETAPNLRRLNLAKAVGASAPESAPSAAPVADQPSAAPANRQPAFPVGGQPQLPGGGAAMPQYPGGNGAVMPQFPGGGQPGMPVGQPWPSAPVAQQPGAQPTAAPSNGRSRRVRNGHRWGH